MGAAAAWIGLPPPYLWLEVGVADVAHEAVQVDVIGDGHVVGVLGAAGCLGRCESQQICTKQQQLPCSEGGAGRHARSRFQRGLVETLLC